MKKFDFTASLRKFKTTTIGAACYIDDVTQRKFCANGLTKEQAEKFAKDEGLRLIEWQAGLSCTLLNCK